ncbi:MAG TPA: hypothetical protein VNT77_10580 [Allosphingosinicella sp.]|nr:hypothetical protein [Allosphingosinicella sp.]
MDRRRLIWVLGGLLAVLAAVLGYTLAQPPSGMQSRERKVETAAVKGQPVDQACASIATYDRLKGLVFEEAARSGNADPANLTLLANNSIVRMENPVVKSRDEALGATVCTGRFVLELPPGAERAFGGQKRLVADVEYSAQAAADGSGLVYRLSGAEPIVSRLAAFNLQNRQIVPSERTELAEADAGAARDRDSDDEPDPAPAKQAAPAPRPAPVAQPRPQPAPAPATANPSFNCRYARTRGERMVCGSSSLAARDRAMAALYYSSMEQANARARRALQQTRNRFLAYRDRCPTEACIAEAYEGRMREIRDIMEDLN